MPQLETYRPSDELRFRIKKLDSAGRTPEQVKAMDISNPIRPVQLGVADQGFAEMIREQQAQYPKCMYRLALRDGKPAGDVVNPNYPMPFDLAVMVGIPENHFRVIGKTKDSGGYVEVRHPYMSQSVGVTRPDGSVDLPASQKQEKELRAKGWVDRIEDIKGLPQMTVAEPPLDALPA